MPNTAPKQFTSQLNIRLTPVQLAALQRIAKHRETYVGTIVRNAIDALIRSEIIHAPPDE